MERRDAALPLSALTTRCFQVGPFRHLIHRAGWSVCRDVDLGGGSAVEFGGVLAGADPHCAVDSAHCHFRVEQEPGAAQPGQLRGVGLEEFADPARDDAAGFAGHAGEREETRVTRVTGVAGFLAGCVSVKRAGVRPTRAVISSRIDGQSSGGRSWPISG